jgi:hypothetical protein
MEPLLISKERTAPSKFQQVAIWVLQTVLWQLLPIIHGMFLQGREIVFPYRAAGDTCAWWPACSPEQKGCSANDCLQESPIKTELWSTLHKTFAHNFFIHLSVKAKTIKKSRKHKRTYLGTEGRQRFLRQSKNRTNLRKNDKLDFW